jgi:ferredoxin
MGGNRGDIIRLAFRRFQELTDAERPSLDIEHIPENCVRCGLCVQKCVSEALHIEKGACPQRNLDQCVQCYGCVEVCPVRGWNIVKKRA